MKLEPDVVIGEKYRLERLLAKGGMGSVWVAYHEKLDSRVAIKFMDPELTESAEARARFEREAKAAAKLRSPHVVQVFDYGVEEDTPYMAMELLEGEDLRTRLKRRGRLGLDEASAILQQACKALRIAGDAGIVHRDLKPGNIFLARSGDDEIVKILDFGVAKAIRAAIAEGTHSGILLGSPHYMSPEQARGGELDPRSDLFSMAVILFQMVTGERPFRGRDIGDVIVKICTEELPVASDFASELPAEVDQFFERALARSRAKRFQSARAMAAEFAAITAAHLGLTAPSSSSGSVQAPPVALPELDSWSDRVESPNASAKTAAADGGDSATPSVTLRSQAHLRLDPERKPGTLTVSTKSVPLPSARSRLVPIGMVVGAVALVVVLLYALVIRQPGAEPLEDATAAGAGEAPQELESAPADLSEPATTSSTAAAAAPTATASAASTATATATAAAGPRPTAPRQPARPTWSPKPTHPAPKPQDSAPQPKGKHPIFGI